MTLTVVVLPAAWTGVLPAAAVPALRGASAIYADAGVPADVQDAVGVTRSEGGRFADDATANVVLLTTDPHSPRVVDAHEVISADPPALLDAVAVMDRLRSPGGCPWDAEQTHESLLKYLLEECYETVDAVESGDRAHLREELGDLLLQVAFHARIA